MKSNHVLISVKFDSKFCENRRRRRPPFGLGPHPIQVPFWPSLSVACLVFHFRHLTVELFSLFPLYFLSFFALGQQPSREHLHSLKGSLGGTLSASLVRPLRMSDNFGFTSQNKTI